MRDINKDFLTKLVNDLDKELLDLYKPEDKHMKLESEQRASIEITAYEHTFELSIPVSSVKFDTEGRSLFVTTDFSLCLCDLPKETTRISSSPCGLVLTLCYSSALEKLNKLIEK